MNKSKTGESDEEQCALLRNSRFPWCFYFIPMKGLVCMCKRKTGSGKTTRFSSNALWSSPAFTVPCYTSPSTVHPQPAPTSGQVLCLRFRILTFKYDLTKAFEPLAFTKFPPIQGLFDFCQRAPNPPHTSPLFQPPPQSPYFFFAFFLVAICLKLLLLLGIT